MSLRRMAPDTIVTAVRCVLLLLPVLFATSLPAQQAPSGLVKVPGGSFDPKEAPKKNGPYPWKGWTPVGDVRLDQRGLRPTPADRMRYDGAVFMAAGSTIHREITVGAITHPNKKRPAPDPSQWTGLLQCDLCHWGPEPSKVVLTLSPKKGGKPIEVTGFTRPKTAPWSQRLLTTFDPKQLEPGDYVLSVFAHGAAIVDEVHVTRVPHTADQMVFAKSNGPHGPDRMAAGALGFEAYTADNHTVLPVFAVRAEGAGARAGLKVGDLIVAVNGLPLPRSSCKPGWQWFEHGHEAVLGRAVEAALAANREKPRVQLSVLRDGKIRDLHLALAPRRPLPANFPFDDTVTPQLYDDLIDFLRRTRRKKGHWQNAGNDWIQTSLSGLAILGRRDPNDAQLLREVADWFLKKFPEPERFGNLGYWAVGYSGMFMAEYYLATEDERALPFFERALDWVDNGFHQSKWKLAALGHGPSGLPYDNKGLIAPAAHVLVFEALAQKAGVRSRVWEKLLPTTLDTWSDPEKDGHGAMGYNASYRDLQEFWSRTGLYAAAVTLRDEQPRMRTALCRIMRARHPWMRNSHAYGQPGDTWGLIGLSLADRDGFAEVMAQWRWAIGGSWEPGFGLRHTTAHMGSPYMGGEGLINPGLAVVLSARHRGLFLTGAPDSDRGWLKRAGEDK